MIEAVNSVLQSAPIVKASAEATSSAESYAANPARVQRVAQAPYVSPYISQQGAVIVTQYRNSDTGQVTAQIPSKNSLQSEQRDQVQVAQQQQVPLAKTVTTGSAPAPQAQPTTTQAAPAQTAASAATAKQVAAFANASQAGNTNAGTVSLFA